MPTKGSGIEAYEYAAKTATKENENNDHDGPTSIDVIRVDPGIPWYY